MKTKITPRQKQLLEIIYRHIKNTGYPPSFEEMKENLNVSSNQSIIDLLKKLEIGGFISKAEAVARSLKILPLGYKILNKKRLAPMVGISAAGPYIESFLDINFQWIELPSEIPSEKLKQSDDVFVIQISGDSMINVGINDGDMLLVKKSKEFKSGDIVVARSDEGSTVKRFIVDGGKTYLKPENPTYKNMPIVPGEINFEGKVILNLSKIE